MKQSISVTILLWILGSCVLGHWVKPVEIQVGKTGESSNPNIRFELRKHAREDKITIFAWAEKGYLAAARFHMFEGAGELGVGTTSGAVLSVPLLLKKGSKGDYIRFDIAIKNLGNGVLYFTRADVGEFEPSIGFRLVGLKKLIDKKLGGR